MKSPSVDKLVALRETGYRVDALINNDITERFLSEVRTKLINEIISAAPTDHDTRAANAFAVKVLDNLRSALAHVAANGLRAEERLSDLLNKRKTNVG